MDPINRTINKLAGSDRFQQRYNAMKKEIMSNQEVQQFFEEHKEDLSPNALDQGMIKLYEFINRSSGCRQCPSLEGCINTMAGYEPRIIIQSGLIDLEYHRCKRKVAHEEQRKTETLIQSMYVPKDVLRATLDDMEIDSDSRMKVHEMADTIVERLIHDKDHYKGLFIYGDFGVGKSYVLGAIANELKAKNRASFILYFPEFLREMKQSIGDQSFAEKMEAVKKASILMLDDIGAESLSSWARDEVLGTILQYRMAEELPTFFTSNFDFKGLEHHLTYSQRGEEEPMKAARIMERIKFLSVPVKMTGKNRRN
ncbi:primosomal protein DnaI [Jeotgalibacillus proteolyticus]|uniref:Primosomal protein DnaI n=1 Tax=Jeotgalibacillus proteolyticus TaxID=2082395 RepID=A0A2S5GEX4_9BACL|nr:primosomal protein DnaI [Jeotgalibacillus proteolyticus]PPA71602.1 primosomal protein DnaI [Jeotgalibacillus proteolyticus]